MIQDDNTISPRAPPFLGRPLPFPQLEDLCGTFDLTLSFQFHQKHDFSSGFSFFLLQQEEELFSLNADSRK